MFTCNVPLKQPSYGFILGIEPLNMLRELLSSHNMLGHSEETSCSFSELHNCPLGGEGSKRAMDCEENSLLLPISVCPQDPSCFLEGIGLRLQLLASLNQRYLASRHLICFFSHQPLIDFKFRPGSQGS